MAERTNAPVSKTGVLARGPEVQILPLPPRTRTKFGSELPRTVFRRDSGTGRLESIMFYVYYLRSKNYNQNYIGYTEDLKLRLKRHNNGLVQSTKPYRPWELIFNGARLQVCNNFQGHECV